MKQRHPKSIRITLSALILSLLVGLGLTTPSLAQEPSGDTLNTPLTNLSQQIKLSSADGQTGEDISAGSKFGWSTVINGNIAVVGAIGVDNYLGAAYIFEKPTDGNWANAPQVAKLTASDREQHDRFGGSVLIDGDTIIIGADAENNLQGAIYVFEKPVSGWTDMTETAKFTLSNRQDYDGFGGALALSENTLVIGANGVDDHKGAAYLFEKPAGGSWANATQTAKLTADSTDWFGEAVAISGDTIVIGAPDTEAQRGIAHIFEKPTGGWANATQTAKLVLPDRKERDHFGSSVATNGNTVFIGASGDNDYQGAVYVYQKPDGGNWSNTAKLTASDGESGIPDPYGHAYPGGGDLFGGAITLSGNRLFVGAAGDDQDKSVNGTRGSDDLHGAVYVFDQPASGWSNATETLKLTAANRGVDDGFGSRLASSGETLIVGAWGTDSWQGAAYIFE